MNKRIVLKDFTFILLVRIDSIHRLENILTVVKCLTRYFDTNINVLECDRYENNILRKQLGKKISYSFKEDFDPILYRTKWLNYMLESVHTPFVAVWDVDIIAPVTQIVQSVEALRGNNCDFVYPYQKRLLDTSKILRELFLRRLDLKFLERNMMKMACLYAPDPVGGAFFCRMNSYKESGLENEAFYGWGLEDGERYMRWKRLGYRVKRIDGPLFHLSHPRGINSSDELQSKEQNQLKMKELISTYFIISKNTSIKYENEISTKNF